MTTGGRKEGDGDARREGKRMVISGGGERKENSRISRKGGDVHVLIGRRREEEHK